MKSHTPKTRPGPTSQQASTSTSTSTSSASAEMGNSARAASIAPGPAQSQESNMLSMAADSFGVDLSGTTFEHGTGVAERHGAAAVTFGDTIHLCDEATARPDELDGLLAHELAHVAQNRSGEPADSEGDAEVNADEAAAAALAGRPFQVSGGMPTRPMRKTFGEWWRETTNTQTEDELAKTADGANGPAAEDAAQGRGYMFWLDKLVDLPTQDAVGPVDQSWEARKATFASGGKTGKAYDALKKHGIGVSWAKEEADLKMPDAPKHFTPSPGPSTVATGTGNGTTLVRTNANGDTNTMKHSTTYAPGERGTGKPINNTVSREDGQLDRKRTARKAEQAIADKQIEAMASLQACVQAKARANRLQAQLDSGANIPPERKAVMVRQIEQAKTIAAEQEQASKRVAQLRALRVQAKDPSQLEAMAEQAQTLGVTVQAVHNTKTTTSEDSTTKKHGLTTNKSMTTNEWDTGVSKYKGEKGRTTKTGLDWKNQSLGRSVVDQDNSTLTLTDAESGFERKIESKDETKRSGGMSLKDGAHLKQSNEVSSSDSLTGERTSKKSNVGLSSKEGLTAGMSEEKRDKDGNTSSFNTSAKVDTDGITTKSDTSAGKEGDFASGKVKASSDGAFTVKMVPVKGKKGSYKLITTVRVGLGLGADASAKSERRKGHADEWKNGGSKLSIGVEGEVKGSVQLQHVRVLSKAEASKYMTDIDAAMKSRKPDDLPTSMLPELKQLKKARAWASEDGTMTSMLSAIGSSNSAKDMKVGDETSLVLEGSAGGGVNLGMGGGTLGASGKKTKKRTVTVSKMEGSKVRVAVQFDDGSERTGKMGMTQGHAAMTAQNTASSGAGQSVTFELDASSNNYNTQFKAITRTLTRSGLVALQAQYAGLVRDSEATTKRGDVTSGTATVGPGTMKVGDSSSFDDALKRTKNDDGIEEIDYTATGTNEANASFGLTKMLEVGQSDKESAKANVDKDGNLTVDVTQTRTDTSFKMPFEKLNVPLDGAGMGALKKRMAAYETEMKKVETHLRQFKLSGSDVDTLAARAGSRSEWQSHASLHGPKPFLAWDALGARLRSAAVPKQWKDVPHAAKLGRAKAIAEFMESAAGSGQEILHSAMRNWGVGALGGGEREAGGGRLWEGTAKMQTELEALLTESKALQPKVDGLTSAIPVDAIGDLLGIQLSQQSAQEGRTQQLLTECEAMGAREVALRMSVLALNVEDPTARAEMLTALERVGERRRAARSACLVGVRPQETFASESETPQAVTLRQIDQHSRLRGVYGTLAALKADEDRLLKEAEAEVDSWLIDHNKVLHLLGTVETSWAIWISTIKRARQLSRALGLKPKDWRVSEGPGATRKALEPGGERLKTLHNRTSGWGAAADEKRRSKRLEGY